jgi:hypothetical protein
MADLRSIDRDYTAVLIMDYQQDIVNSVAAHQPQLLDWATAVLSGPGWLACPSCMSSCAFGQAIPR